MGTHPIFESDFDCLTDNMKLNLLLLSSLEASKLYFGRNGCEFGPSYWCENISKAHECGEGAKQFCIENRWNEPSAPDEVCETCKTAVGLVHMYLTDKKTRSDVVDLLDHACNVVPDEHLKMKCFDLVRQETDVVFDFIEKVTDPSVICHGMQLCHAGTAEELAKAIELGIDNLPAATVKITEKSEPKPEPVLDPIPIDVGFKSLDSLSGQEQLGSETCVLCKMAVAKIDEFIANPENDGKVMDALEETCDNLPGDYADRCKAIIEMYGPQLIKMVEANLQPDAICGALGLCDGQKKTIPQRCQETKQVGLCRALIESFFFNTETNKCEQFYYGGCGGNNNRFESMDQCNDRCTNALGMNYCQDCKLAIAYLDAYLGDDHNEADIVAALEKVCDSVPESYKMECQDIIDTYGTEILKYADSILDPKFVCEKVGLCPSETKPKMLVGANKCTFGPSYWCASMDNAEECNAKEHCLKMGLLN